MTNDDRSKVFQVDTKNVLRSEVANGTIMLALDGQAAIVPPPDETQPRVTVPVKLDGYAAEAERRDGQVDGYATLVLTRDRLITLATTLLAAVRELDARAADRAGYANAWDDPNSYQNERR